MKQGLQLRMTQNLALPPPPQPTLRLLQLSAVDLEQEINPQIEENPFLEREDEASVTEFGGHDRPSDAPVALSDRLDDIADDPAQQEDFGNEHSSSVDTEWQDVAESWEGDASSVQISHDDSEWGNDAPSHADKNSDEAQDYTGHMESLCEVLHRQTLSLRLSPAERAALRFLIESLDEDGYLCDGLPELAASICGLSEGEEFDSVLEHLNLALKWLQSLEPPGVGARDLAECLRLQLLNLQASHPSKAVEVALHLCDQPMLLLARREHKKLAQLSGHTEAWVQQAADLIATLEPKPGRPYTQAERNIIVPDVVVKAVHQRGKVQLKVSLNPDVMPKLRVLESLGQDLTLRASKPAPLPAPLQEKLQHARWFVKSLQQRFETLLRVSMAIVAQQEAFFIQGAVAMRPMTMRDIALAVDMHESTISRVTTQKYMVTPQGTYELKHFFASGLQTDTGEATSSTAVRAMIAQLIAQEDPRKPLSDQHMADTLAARGIDCARRTVAKYRESLGLAPAHLRKTR